MATNGGQIKFGVGFNVDKSGLNDLKKSLQELRNMKLDDFDLGKKLNTKDANNKLLELKRTVHGVENALKDSFNADLGTLNVTKLNSELKKIGIDKIRNDFYDMGAAGQNAFRNLATEALTTNRQLKQTHNVIDKMAETLGNTLKWNISSGAINRMSGAIQEAYGFTKSLDSSLNDIMIVTGKNADEMERFAQKANQAAKSLAAGTTDYTKASLIYYQQGLSDEESAARAETTLKVANVTGQSADTVSEQLTAVWNGYKVSAEEAELYIDKLSAVAADTAADLDGLSTGMSKVASAANLMGVDIDQLNATLATVVSVTQQAPESIGTAFKTIYARMGDIEAGLDTETTLGEYTKKMKEIGGISVLDENNQLREMGDVIEEVGSKWGSLSKEQQVALSQVMAGTRQYNNLLALFDNWDMYTDALNTSANAAGTLQEQQDIYMESTEAHLQQMRTSFEDLYMSLFDAETINDFADAMTTVVEGLTNFVDALGGGQGILNTFGTLATRVFSKNIAQGIATTITNLRVARENASATRAELELTEGVLKGDKVSDENLKMLVEWKKEILGFGSLVSNEQNEQANAIIKTTNELMNQKEAWNENLNEVNNFLNSNTRIDENVKIDFNDFGDNEEEKEKADKALQQIENRIKYNSKALEKAKEKIKEYYKTFEDVETGKKSVEEEAKVRKVANEKINESIKALINQNKNIKLSEEAQNELNIALEEYHKALESNDQSAILNSGNKVLNIYSKINKDIENGAKHTRKVIEEEANGASRKIQEKIDETENGFKKFTKDLKLTNIIKGFIDLTAGIGQVQTGVQTLIGITDIWNNQELTADEKFGQIISALSMGLGSIVSGASAIWPILKALKVSILGIAQSEFTAKTAAQAMWKAISGPIGKTVAAIALVGVAIYKIVKAHESESEAARKACEETQKGYKAAADAARAAREEYENLKKSFDTYKSQKDALKELEKGTKDYEDALKGASEEAQNLLEQLPELIKYVQRDENGNISFTNPEEVEKIIKQKEDEAKKAERVRGIAEVNKTQAERNNTFISASKSLEESWKPEHLKETLDYANSKNKTLTKAELLEILAISWKDQYEGNVTDEKWDALDEQLTNYIKTEGLVFDKEGNFNLEDSTIELNQNGINRLNDIFENGLTKNEEGLYTFSLKDEFEDLFKEDEENKKIVDAGLKDVLLQKNLNTYNSYGLSAEGQKKVNEKIYNDFQKPIRSYEEVAAEFNNATKEEIFRKYAELNPDQYLYSDGNIIDKKTNATIDIDEEKAKGYLIANEQEKDIGQYKNDEAKADAEEYIKAFSEIENKVEKFGEKYNISVNGIISGSEDLSNAFNSIDFDTYNELKGMSQEELIQQLGNLTEKQIKELGYENAKEIYKSIQEGLKNADLISILDNQLKKVEIDISTTGNLITTLKEGKELTKEQKTALEKLESEYEVLQSIQDKTSAEYINNLLKIQQMLEEEKIQIEENKNSLLIDQAIELDVNTDEFEETMKDIAEQQYKVVVAVKADVQSDFDNLVDNMTDIDSMASKIGDDFIVAASDLEELNDMFPGILENMKITEDGSVQLNSTIAKEAIEASKAQIKADTAATVEKLLNQAKEMEAKRDAAKNVAKILRDSITNEEVADETKAKLDNALQILKSDNSASLAEQEQGDTKNVAETAAASATEMANNYGEAYKKMSEDAIEWAKTAQNAIKASTDINVNIPELPVNFGGLNLSSSVTIKESNKADLQDAEEMDGLTDADKEEIAAYYDSVGDSWDKLASNTFGKAMELMAREEESENKLNNIQSGKGADGQKDGSKEPDKEDKIDEEIDRYREVNELLARQEKSLNRLQKEQDKLYGKSLIKNLEEQSKILKEQEETLRRKLEIAREESKELKNEISQQGIEFDDYGYIINYEEAIQAKQDELNAFIDAYNNMSKEEQENHKEELQKRKENFEDFKASVDRYATLMNEEIPEIATSISDSTVQQAENKIKAFEIEIEIKLDMNEAKRQWASFMKDYYYRDNPRGQAEQLYNTAKVEYSDFTIQRNAAQDTQKEIDKLLNGKDSIYKNTEEGMKKAKEDFTNYYQEALSSYQDTFNAVEESKQLWLTGIDDTINTLNENAEVYSQLDSLYNHDKNMITMLYGEDAFESLDKIYEKMNTNNQKEIINIKKRKDYYKEMMDAAANDEEREKWKQAWLNATDELNAKTEETVSLILEKHSKTIESIIDEMNKSLTNGLGLEYIGKEWDLIQKQSEQYFDSVEKGFELQGLQNSFDEALDATDSIAGQARINKLMEEQMKMLREKDKLTKYDVDRAQLLLDIELKRIALEEARQNKSTMRLRRDAQGNYSYQYVEDEEATKTAEEDLQKSEYDLYELDKGQVETSADNILSTYNEITEEIARIQNDNTLTQEERDAELSLLEDKYGGILQTDLDNFSQASKNLGEEGLKNIFGEDSKTLDFIKKLNEKGVSGYIDELVEKTNKAVEGTQDEINKTRDKAGEDSKKGEGAYIDNDVDKTTVEDFKKNMSDLITKENEKLDALKQSYDNSLIVLEDIKKEFSSLNKLYHYLLKLQGIEIPTSSTTPSDTSGNNKPTNKPTTSTKPTNKPTTSTSPTNKPTTSTSPTNKPTTSTSPTVIDATQPTFTPSHSPLSAPLKNGILEIGDSAIFDRGYYSTTSDNSSNTLKYNSSKTVKIVNYRKNDNFPVQIENPGDIPVTGYIWVKEKDLYQYKTGGLVDKTGPAWLDGTKSQPELVLNSKDTQNLLDTIKILRNADSLANSLNRSMSERMEARLNTEFKRLSNMMDIIKIEREPGNDSLEQNVHIKADFPNVSDSNEIEQALMNLVNVASQYAYRR